MEQNAKQEILEEAGDLDSESLDIVQEIADATTADANDNANHGSSSVNDGAEKQSKRVSPGRLKTKGSVVIHTRSAHDLFYGRRGDKESGINQIVGLTLFATNANNLTMLCQRDDPYAEAVLIKIENLFDDFEKDLKNKVKHLQELLDGMEGMVIDFHESEDPITIPLEFGTPYGYIAVRCLSQYDKLVTLAYSAKQIGLLVQSDWHRYVVKTRTKLRHIFHVSTRYRFGGATRDDIAANNAAARSVIEKYGDLAEEILMKDQRARFVSHESA
ncbi:MAG: PFL_4669 family integrating conjugative element protein [Candidatus Thiodiazotropha sp. 6PLUC2]|nr:TIGR03761 family integrating conjugative element protein [Candidatus Thiodiazotropha lotti]MCW4218817.1 TIGR03761 family integrating conjugative element protein [Candidatus Thiodiazotropha lotti]